MPTYRNDSTTYSFMVRDCDDAKQLVRPGESVQTYENLASFSVMIETSPLPALARHISGEDCWVGPVVPKGHLNVSVSGESWNAVVELQRRFSNVGLLGLTWKPKQSFTANDETLIEDTDPNASYRLGIPAGRHVSGEVVVVLSR